MPTTYVMILHVLLHPQITPTWSIHHHHHHHDDPTKLMMNAPHFYPTSTSVDKCTLHTCAKRVSLIDDMSRTTANPNPVCLMTCQEQWQTLTRFA